MQLDQCVLYAGLRIRVDLQPDPNPTPRKMISNRPDKIHPYILHLIVKFGGILIQIQPFSNMDPDPQRQAGTKVRFG